MSSIPDWRTMWDRLRTLDQEADAYGITRPPYIDENLTIYWAERLLGRRIVTENWGRYLELKKEYEDWVWKMGRWSRAWTPCRAMVKVYFCRTGEERFPEGWLPQRNSRLLMLPIELKLKILEEVETVQVLWVCKQLYLEGKDVLMRRFAVQESELPEYVIDNWRGMPDGRWDLWKAARNGGLEILFDHESRIRRVEMLGSLEWMRVRDAIERGKWRDESEEF